MLMKSYPGQATFGLLPQPERNPASVITSTVINGMILMTVLYVGAMARQTINQHRYEETMLILPAKEPPPTPKVKIPPPPPPKLPRVKFEAPKINLPKPQPKPIQMEAKLAAPAIKAGKPAVILAPQPKSALAAAAMPAQDSHVKLSTAPVHFGQTFGVTPNPTASRPANVAAIGNPYGGMRGPALAPHGRVGSTGFGNGTRFGSNAGVVGKVASVGIPGGTGTARVGPAESRGKVASAGIPSAPTALVAASRITAEPKSTNLEVLSKPTVQYTSEARQLKVQGDVILRVTFTANGQVVIRGVMHGLGYGLDEEARRVAQQIRFRPATRNGQAVDMTTNITITFQLA
jgi:TonB family protein